MVDIEPDYIYPLVKSSMFKSAIIDNSDKYVIVTQKAIREDTSHIEIDAPKAWQYLSAHRDFFEKRKSLIYKNASDYAMFGIVEYSYKVGVSRFYNKPLFSFLSSEDGYPIMTDDTSYFICLPIYNAVYTDMLILNFPNVQKFLSSIAFWIQNAPLLKKY